MAQLQGAYACICLVKGVGLAAFRDPFGIRRASFPSFVVLAVLLLACMHTPQACQTRRAKKHMCQRCMQALADSTILVQ